MINYKKIEAIFFDFDGVLTDNFAFVDGKGNEMVKISRSDGIAFNILKKIKIPCYILSAEKNNVVNARAKKLKITCYNNLKRKEIILTRICKENKYNIKKVIYIGNDVNDISSMNLVGFSLCPKDSHKEIKKIATKVLSTEGGKGVVREIIEKIFKIDIKNFYI